MATACDVTAYHHCGGAKGASASAFVGCDGGLWRAVAGVAACDEPSSAGNVCGPSREQQC